MYGDLTELSNLQTAIWGDKSFSSTSITTTGRIKDSQIDVTKVLFRSPRAVQDLFQLTILPLTLISLVVFRLTAYTKDLLLLLLLGGSSGTAAASNNGMLQEATTGTAHFFFGSWMTTTASSTTTSMVGHAILDAFIVFITLFVLLALPLTKIMLTERDQQLARGVRDACHIVHRNRVSSSAIGDDTNNESISVVVVILGLLHVNNVAKKLLQTSETPQ